MPGGASDAATAADNTTAESGSCPEDPKNGATTATTAPKREKKLVRAKRLSSADSSHSLSASSTASEDSTSLDRSDDAKKTKSKKRKTKSKQQQQQQQQPRVRPTWCERSETVVHNVAPGNEVSKSNDQNNKDVDKVNKSSNSAVASSAAANALFTAFRWRKALGGGGVAGAAATEMGDSHHTEVAANPKWHKASVRAVQLQQQADCNHVATNKVQTGNGSATLPPPPPPPRQWRPAHDDPAVVGVVGLEAVDARPRPQCSTLTVDMGKVVGVLRTHHHERRLMDNNVSSSACASCSADSGLNANQVVPNDSLDESLCGDPLVYATFVAPVQQYSTETEPSRQPSLNIPSRTPSLKQNSGEAMEYPAPAPAHAHTPFPRLPYGANVEQRYSDEVQDLYKEIPVVHHPQGSQGGLPLPPSEQHGTDCMEISQEELDNQAAQERLSFISAGSSQADDDEEEGEEELPADDASLEFPPLPPTPPPKVMNEGAVGDWGSGEESDTAAGSRGGTIKRKSKRSRNPRDVSQGPPTLPPPAMAPTAIVIVHKRPSQSRGSLDNLSESSISFHENELEGQPLAHAPTFSTRGPGAGSTRGGSVPRHCEQPRDAYYANRDSVRESWMSLGSATSRGSSFRMSAAPSVPAIPSECSVPSLQQSACYRQPPGPHQPHPHPHSRSVHSLPRRSSSSSHGLGGGRVTPSTRLRSSSRESGSSSSIRNVDSTSVNKIFGSGSASVLPKAISDDGRCSGLSLPSSTGSGPPPPSGLRPMANSSNTPCLSSIHASSLHVGIPDLVDILDHSDTAMNSREQLLTEMVSNLQQRFKKDHIYTSIGNTLLSLNPYRKVPLYNPDAIDVYRCHCLSELPPHIYAVADRCWRGLREMNCDQSIVIYGESGSGKTESFKLCLQYLAAVTSHTPTRCVATKYQILQSNPLFEAFGNAKTSRNDNSTRFGKYLEISFDFKGDPVGGLISNFALEKSRVNRYSYGERNFHIFYQLLHGGDLHMLKEFRLHRHPEKYRILQSTPNGKMGFSSEDDSALSSASSSAHTSTTGYQSIDDRRDFCITKRAMEDLGMSDREIMEIFSIIAAILKLGNLTFVPITNMDGTEGCSLGNDYELYDICSLLRADFESLQTGLLTRTVECRNEVLLTDLSSIEAEASRDSLTRAMYGRLFTWLMNRTNEAIKVVEPRKHKVIALLDMFGFETAGSGVNGFQQLVINYANEKLHQLLIATTLHKEQEEYVKEGFEWQRLDFFDNSIICNLIEKSHHDGMLFILDEVTLRKHQSCDTDHDLSLEELRVSRAEQFVERLRSNGGRANNPHLTFPERSALEPDTSFQIKHYAGLVTYDAKDFVDRNSDILDRDLCRAMFLCDHKLLKDLFPEGNPRRTTRRRPATTGTQFKITLGVLVSNLKDKESHYIHCIKPNDSKDARLFDTALVRHQISYQSLPEKLMLRLKGFAFRMEYDDFLQRYKMLSEHTWPFWRGPSAEGVTYLLREVPINASEYAFGRTRLFIRSSRTAEMLEEFRRAKIDDLATMIQKTYRGFVGRREWMRRRDAQIVISNYWKRWKDKSHVVDLKQRRKEEWAVLVIQKYFRSWQRRRFLLRLARNLPSESPLSKDWPSKSVTPRPMRESSALLRRLYHKWRCHRYRLRFDQIARNRMREKVTASILFKDRKASYPRSIVHPFLGDYVRLRQNPQWKKTSVETNDQYVVFADIINKITRSSGKFVPILFVISTSSMLIMDQRTMQIKYRIAANDILKLSMSPYHDDIAVFHVRAGSPSREIKPGGEGAKTLATTSMPGCLSSETATKRKGDFVLQTGHVIEIVTKLFLVVQNATGRPPQVHIATEFEANFGGDSSVLFTFKKQSNAGSSGHVKLVKRGNRFEVLV